MKVYHVSKRYAPEAVVTRYVRFDGTAFRFAEVGEDRRFDLRQGYVSEEELPRHVARKAKLRAGVFPGYVEWPLEIDGLPVIDVRRLALDRMLERSE